MSISDLVQIFIYDDFISNFIHFLYPYRYFLALKRNFG